MLVLIAAVSGLGAIVLWWDWVATKGEDPRWGVDASAWRTRHPALWGGMYGGVWMGIAIIWAAGGHVGLALFQAGMAVIHGVERWHTVRGRVRPR